MADRSGVISYRIDGLEESLKTGDFSYLNEQYLNSLDIQTGQIVALSNTSSKIVDNFQCDIVCILDSEEARNSEVGKSIKLRLQNSEEVPAKILYKATEKNNKVLLVFEINNDVAELIKYRKTSFDVIWWSDSGLKIPNSAIKYDGNGYESDNIIEKNIVARNVSSIDVNVDENSENFGAIILYGDKLEVIESKYSWIIFK